MKLIGFFSVVLTILGRLLFLPTDTQDAEGTTVVNSGSSYSRLCEERDLRGLWKVVKWIPYMEIKGADWRRAMFLRNQWFEFDGDGHLKTLASNKKMKLENVVKHLTKAPWGVKIKFTRRGFCEISSEAEKFPDSIWRCAVITRDIVLAKRKYDLRKGDVVMTLLGDDESILYFRLLRKVDTLVKGKSEIGHPNLEIN